MFAAERKRNQAENAHAQVTVTLSLLLMQQVINISTFFLYHSLITVYLFMGSQVKHSKDSNCTEIRQGKPNLTQTQKVKSGRKRPYPGNTLHMMSVLLIQNATTYYGVISMSSFPMKPSTQSNCPDTAGAQHKADTDNGMYL